MYFIVMLLLFYKLYHFDKHCDISTFLYSVSGNVYDRIMLHLGMHRHCQYLGDQSF